jgi:SPX domain protein involved in polyphosphate accumulation
MSPEIISALISSLVGGIVVGVMNHLLTRRKTNAETKHFELNNEKLALEIKKLQKELQEVKTTILEKMQINPNKSITFTEETYRIPGDFDRE